MSSLADRGRALREAEGPERRRPDLRRDVEDRRAGSPRRKKLHEVSDYVLDNGGTPGDAIVEILEAKAGLPAETSVKAGPTSTFIGATLLNLLSLEVITWLKAGGHALPILRSQNMPNAIEYNRELGKKYKGRLSRQLA